MEQRSGDAPPADDEEKPMTRLCGPDPLVADGLVVLDDCNVIRYVGHEPAE